MGDDQVSTDLAADGGDVQATEKPTVGPVSLEDAKAARAAKIASFRAGGGVNATASQAAAVEKPADKAAPLSKVEAKLDEPKADDPPKRGLDALEQRDKRLREQLAADRQKQAAEIAADRAEAARLLAEAKKQSATAPTIEELQKLAKTPGKTLELLKRLGVETEDEYERYARDAYAVSKSGKADPKNKQHADAMAEKQGRDSELADLRQTIEELKSGLTAKEQQAAARDFANRYADEATKAIPSDEPTFIARELAANPNKAKSALLALGALMEREAIAENGGQYDDTMTPSHAEVIARYERERRDEYKDRGFTEDEVDALLKRKALAAPVVAAKPSRTLDVTARPTIKTNNGNPTRDEKIAAARAGRLKLQAEST